MTSSPSSRFRLGTVGISLLFAIVFGIALILALADIGFARIGQEILAIGFGLVGIIAVHLGQLAFCALAWQSVLPAQTGTPSPGFGNLLLLRWIRESINSLLPAAQIGGELVAGRLMARSGINLPVAGASIIADVTVETLTHAIFTLIGLALLVVLAQGGDVLHWASIGLMVAVVFAAIAVFAQRLGGVRLFEKTLLAIAGRMGWSKLDGVAGLDEQLRGVYRLRGRLFLAGFHHLAAWTLGTAEVMIAAYALDYRLSVGEAFAIESLAQTVRSAAFFIPGALGVQEGSYVVVAGVFGVPPHAAVTMSLAKRVRELALGLPGLAVWHSWELRIRRALTAT